MNPYIDGPDGPMEPTMFEILRAIHEWSMRLQTAINDDERKVILDKIDELIGR